MDKSGCEEIAGRGRSTHEPKNAWNVFLTSGPQAHAVRKATATTFSICSARFSSSNRHGDQGLNGALTSRY